MAVTPQNNDAFFREVDEELRRDKTEMFFRRYGRLVALAVGVVLLASGAWLWWQNHREQRAAGEAERLVAAFADAERGNSGAAAARGALEPLGKSSSDGYRATALLTLADMAADKGDAKAAAAQFAAIANDEGLPRPFRDLALVRQTAAEFDTLPPGTVLARLQGLAVAGNPWFGSAGELVAIAWLRQGKRAEAGRMFAALARDPGVPETIRSRSVQMAGVLGVDATSPATAAAGSGGTNIR